MHDLPASTGVAWVVLICSIMIALAPILTAKLHQLEKQVQVPAEPKPRIQRGGFGMTGTRSSVRRERLITDQERAGSNPVGSAFRIPEWNDDESVAAVAAARAREAEAAVAAGMTTVNESRQQLKTLSERVNALQVRVDMLKAQQNGIEPARKLERIDATGFGQRIRTYVEVELPIGFGMIDEERRLGDGEQDESGAAPFGTGAAIYRGRRSTPRPPAEKGTDAISEIA